MKEIVNKREFMEQLSEEDFQAGLFKFNIPDSDNIHSMNGEGVWGWLTPEEYKKYDDDKFTGKVTAILMNTPMNYYPILKWCSEVVVQCHGECRPTLDPEWVKEYLL